MTKKGNYSKLSVLRNDNEDIMLSLLHQGQRITILLKEIDSFPENEHAI
jgi:hypothetical protein